MNRSTLFREVTIQIKGDGRTTCGPCGAQLSADEALGKTEARGNNTDVHGDKWCYRCQDEYHQRIGA